MSLTEYLNIPANYERLVKPMEIGDEPKEQAIASVYADLKREFIGLSTAEIIAELDLEA